MELNTGFTLLVFVGTIALLCANKNISLIFAMATLLLLVCGQLTLAEVFRNLANPGLITLVLLLLISVAIDKTGLIKAIGRSLITGNYRRSLGRLLSTAFVSSAVLNNTAVVASLIGPIKQNQHHPASRLLLPLSYAAILGGTVTLIGTSTNLIVDGFLLENGHPGFAFWDFTWYGLTAGICCCLVMYVSAPLLPTIASSAEQFQHYTIEARVGWGSALIGKSIEANHLRNLPELFLVEIVRGEQLISPVTPDIVLQRDDKLIFSGNVKRMDSLNHIDGLTLYADREQGLQRQNLTEVIVANRAMVIGKTLKRLGFRALFDAAVVAIRRDGEQLSGKLGAIKLRAGDFLLLATGPDFQHRHNLKNNFFMVSEVSIQSKLSNRQEWLTIGGFGLAIAAAAAQLISLPIALLCLLAVFVGGGVINGSEIKRSLPVNLVIIIVGAMSLAIAIEKTGLIALFIAVLQPVLNDGSPFVALVAVYLVTLVLTELVTNNAAAALVFPFAHGIAEALALPIMPFALAVAFAASASFISPYGYQTNLLVFSAGNYRFGDFVKAGLPISALYSVIVLLMLKWQFGW